MYMKCYDEGLCTKAEHTVYFLRDIGQLLSPEEISNFCVQDPTVAPSQPTHTKLFSHLLPFCISLILLVHDLFI